MDESRVVGVTDCAELVDAIVFTKAENFGVEPSATLPDDPLPEATTSLVEALCVSFFMTVPLPPGTGAATGTTGTAVVVTTGVETTGVVTTGVVTTGVVTTGVVTTGVTTTGVTTGGVTTTGVTTGTLAANTTYYWRVRATNAKGTSSYSTVRSFKTGNQ